MGIDGLLNSISLSWSDLFPMIASLLIALLLLLAGLLIARGIGMLASVLLRSMKLDTFSEQIGFNAVLERGSIKRPASELFGDLLYWLVALVVIIGVAGAFGLSAESALIKIFAYMGIVFLAALILGVGLFLAGLVSSIVRIVMANFGIEGAGVASRIIYYIVVIFTFLAALAQLGVNVDIIGQKLDVIVGAVGLAAAIAFGLGCKDMAADFLHNLFKSK